MAETLHIPESGKREEIYHALLPQIESLIFEERNLIANLANISAVLRQAFGFFWVGFYLMEDNELVLGPFQGDLACSRIPLDKGVCGACASQRKVLIVPDVEEFPGHIACSSFSKSEIVLPLVSQGEVKLVLDVDSDKFADFSEVDKLGLEAVLELVKKQHFLADSR